MTIWLHSTVLATTLAATAAIGIASAALYSGEFGSKSAKADRLTVTAPCHVAALSEELGQCPPPRYVTHEQRLDGTSVLVRVPAGR